MRQKVEYYTIKIDSQEKMSWVYSASDFQNILIEGLQGHTLKKVFVSLYGYLDAAKREKDHFDFSYRGGTLILIFENRLLELVIHTEGMMGYRIVPIYNASLPTCGRIDYPPSETGIKGDNNYYDLGKEFDLNCLEQTVQKIKVNKTDTYPFDLEGFDEMLAIEAEKQGDLPSGVELFMSNGVVLKLLGSCIEYFFVKLEEHEK